MQLKKEEDIVQNREVKAVLFDLDGVLVDSFETWFMVLNDTLFHFKRKPLTRKEFTKRFGFPIENDMKTIFHGKTIRQVLNSYIRCYRHRTYLVKIFAHSIPLLKELRGRKLKIGLVTNSSRPIVNTVLKKYKLKEYFDVVITMNDIKNGKPSPESVIKACEKLKVDAKNAIFIGDTKNDMMAGKRAKCITVGYKIKGDYKISSLQNLLGIINQINLNS